MNVLLRRMAASKSGQALVAVVLGFLCFGPESWAYRKEYHFYLNQIMGDWCGLGPGATTDLTYPVALANYSIDAYELTDAGANVSEWFDFSKAGDRRLFHFPLPAGQTRVVRNTPEAAKMVEWAMSRASAEGKDFPVYFGAGLHVYQDSWSHEGFTATWGHFYTISCDFPGNDVPKAMEMAEASYAYLDRFSRAMRGQGCLKSWAEIAGTLEGWNSLPVDGLSGLTDTWRQLAKQVTGLDLDPATETQANGWSDRFLAIATDIKKTLAPPADDLDFANLPNSSELDGD